MKIDNTTAPRGPRSWIVMDIESAVLDETGDKRYQAMEGWVPADDKPSRRGYRRSEDPLTCPRWIFQQVTTAAVLVLVEDAQGGVDVRQFVTLSPPDHSECEILAGVLKVLADALVEAELVTWAGLAHDTPLLFTGCMRHGLTLPRGWGWLVHSGFHRERHLDLARAMTAGMKMKPVHLAEVLAAMDIPAQITCPPFSVTGFIYAGRWDEVQRACEVDVISTALLLARWRHLTDGHAEADAVENRILRRVIELRQGRRYVAALEAHRGRRFTAKFAAVSNDVAVLAPWLQQDVA